MSLNNKKLKNKKKQLLKYSAATLATTMVVPVAVQAMDDVQTEQDSDTQEGKVPFNVLSKPLMEVIQDQLGVQTAEAADVIEIHTIQDLNNIRNDLSGHYVLMNDLDLTGINWDPIGDYDDTPFTGTIDGNGYTIKNLMINRSNERYVGLFGYTDGATIKNLTIENPTIHGGSYVGALVGRTSESTNISNVGVEGGTVVGEWSFVGGLVGNNRFSSIDNAYATGDVEGSDQVGGLVGSNFSSTIDNAYATGDVEGKGNSSVGGLVGGLSGNLGNIHSSIDNAYATGDVKGNYNVGGLVGYVGNDSSSINNAYATGDVEGNDYVGGLVGLNNDFSINNAYATGDVEGNDYVGGLVGRLSYNSSINNAYATGDVEGNDYVGGVVGDHYRSTTNNVFALNSSVNGSSNVGQAVGSSKNGTLSGISVISTMSGGGHSNYVQQEITPEEALQQMTYQGFDFQSVWKIDEGETLPYLVNNPHKISYNPDTGEWIGESENNEPPSEVENLTAEEASDEITLTWDEVENADEYRIERDGEEIVTISDTTYTDTGLEANTSYEYAVISINEYGESEPVTITAETVGAIPIYSTDDLDDIRNDLSGHYVLMNDLDLTGINWDPIGDNNNEFRGTFDGNGYTIKNLMINRSNERYVGLFGYTRGATIKNLTIEHPTIHGNVDVGALVGYTDTSTAITDVGVKGGTIVGEGSWIGGLVGHNFSSSIDNAYATGDVEGNNDVGGLVGLNVASTINNAYATGDVEGNNDVGGLVGSNTRGSTINNAYATGDVEGNDDVGGVIGRIYGGGANNIFALNSSVNGSSNVGQAVGRRSGGTLSGISVISTMSGGGHSNYVQQVITPDEALQQMTYTMAGFDFGVLTGNPIWGIDEGTTLPYLQSNPYKITYNSDTGGWEPIDSSEEEEELPSTSYTVEGSTVELSWSEVEGAERYHIYRKAGDGEREHVFTTRDTNAVLVGHLPEEHYEYTVVAVDLDGYEGEHSNAVTFTSPAIKGERVQGTMSRDFAWEPVDGAVSYKVIEYKTNGEIVEHEMTETSFALETTIDTGSAYAIKIIPMDENGVEGHSTYVIYETPPNKIETVDVSNVTSDSAQLTWDEVTGAVKYVVKDTKTDEVLYQGTETSVELTELESLVDYDLEVYGVSEDELEGPATSVTFETERVLLPAPVLIIVENSNNSISFSWEEVDGATEYVLERRPKQESGMFSALSTIFSSNDGFEEVYRGDGTSFSDSNLPRGTRYEYRLKAVNGNSESEEVIQEAYTYQTVTFNWLPVYDDEGNEAVEYEVYRNDTLLGTTEGTSYTDNEAVPGETNLYRAIPVFADGEKGNEIEFPEIDIPIGDDDDVDIDPPEDQDQGNPPEEEDPSDPDDPEEGDEDEDDEGEDEDENEEDEDEGEGDDEEEDPSDPDDPEEGDEDEGEGDDEEEDPSDGGDDDEEGEDDNNTPTVPDEDKDKIDDPDNGNIGTPSNPPNPVDDEDPEDLDEPEGPGADVGPDFIRLAWYAIDGAAFYEIHRDGSLLHTKDHVEGKDIYSYTDHPIDPTKTHHYEIIPYAADGTPIEDADGNNPIPDFTLPGQPTFTAMHDVDGNELLDLSDVPNGTTIATPEVSSVLIHADYDEQEDVIAEYYTEDTGWEEYTEHITLDENGMVFLRLRTVDNEYVSAYSFIEFANIVEGEDGNGDGDDNGDDNNDEDGSGNDEDDKDNNDYINNPFTILDGFRGSKVLEMEGLPAGVEVELRNGEEVEVSVTSRIGDALLGHPSDGAYDVYFDGVKHEDQAIIGEKDSSSDGDGNDEGEEGKDVDYHKMPYDVIEGFRGSIGIEMAGLKDGEQLEVMQDDDVIASATSRNSQAFFGQLNDGTYTLNINGEAHETPLVIDFNEDDGEGSDIDFTTLDYEVEEGFRGAAVMKMEGLTSGQQVELRLDGQIIKSATSRTNQVNFGQVVDGTYDLYINNKKHEKAFVFGNEDGNEEDEKDGTTFTDAPFELSEGFRGAVELVMEDLPSGYEVSLYQDGEEVISRTSTTGKVSFGSLSDGEYEVFIEGVQHEDLFIVDMNKDTEEEGKDGSAFKDVPFEVGSGFRGAVELVMEDLPSGYEVSLYQDGEEVISRTSTTGKVNFGFLSDGEYEVFIEDAKHSERFVVGEPQDEKEEKPEVNVHETPFTITDGFRGSKTLELEGLESGQTITLQQEEETIHTVNARSGNAVLGRLDDGIYNLFIDEEKHVFSIVIGDVEPMPVSVEGLTLTLDTFEEGDVIAAKNASGDVFIFDVDEEGQAELTELEEGTYELYLNGFIPLATEENQETETITIDME